MQKLLKEYLEELNRKQKKSRKAAVAALLLVVMVVGSVAGILAQYGVAMTGMEKCGMEEHQHTGECYAKKLICELEEQEGHTHTEACAYPAELACGLEENEEHTHDDTCYEIPEGYACGLEESEGHTHTEECYTEELVCGKEEHIHTEACYVDEAADVEDQAVWESQYAGMEWKGVWGEDLVTAAGAQIGYRESVNNYVVAEDGSRKGYTRYGQFAGDVYADWDAAFVNFCLYYAKAADSGMFAGETDSSRWYESMANSANGIYLTEAEGYEPKAGDIIFFHREGEETGTQMGIVSSYNNETNEIQVIEGNSENEVRENKYAADDGHIFAYLKVSDMEQAYKDINGDADEAETEEQAVWDEQYAETEWKGAWGEDLVTAASVQIGYQESASDYVVAEDGSRKGYTQYGQFAGDVYADWDAAFVNFCLYYAKAADSGMFAGETDSSRWYESMANSANGIYLTAAEGYEPKAGDIIFFQREGEETGTQMGIVSSYNNETNEIQVIEGNSENEVRENKYAADDGHIFAYLKVSDMEQAYKDSDGDAAGTDEADEIPAEVVEELENSPAYEASYEDDMGTIHVAAGEGAVPEGAELSVRKIEPVMTTAEMDDEEAAVAQEINDQYEFTARKLSEESEKNNATLEGFLAYDICFLADGVEIEPNGPVKVTMDFHEAVKPEGVSEDAVVGVNHLKEDETAEDGILVEDLTEKAATTITTVEEEPTVEKVELVTETFSVFTVTWQVPLGGSKVPVVMSVYHTIEDGKILWPEANKENDVEDDKSYDIQNLLELEAVSKKDVTEEGNGENGYITYVPKEIKLYFGTPQVQDGRLHIEEQVEYKGKVKTVQFRQGMIKFYSADEKLLSEVPLMNLGGYFLTVVYGQEELGLGIEDKIKKEGYLVPDLGADHSVVDEAVAEGKTVKYVWSKSVNEQEYKEVVQTSYSNGRYNVADNGEWINVALDGGALNDAQSSVKYRVELRIDDETIAVSPPFQIPYYNEVRNGSFENPSVRGVEGVSFEQLDQYAVEGWNTTASDKMIEIAEATDGKINGLYEQGSYFEAAEGGQFAELNATQTGSLYQDILVEKGTLLHYSFAHRGRVNSANSGKDQMHLLIVPTIIAEGGCGHKHPSDSPYTQEIDTQAEVECLLNHKNDTDDKGNFLYPGVYEELCTANTTGWTVHNGAYMPIYNLNRFFFVSAQKDSPHEGNFLDNVHFSQYLPKPEEGKFSFSINKTITGLQGNLEDQEEKESELRSLIAKLVFEIKITDENGQEVSVPDIPTTISANEMLWKKSTGDDSWYGTIAFNNKIIGENNYKITVTEQNQNVESYACSTVVEETVSGGGASSGGGQTAVSGTVDVQKNVSKGLHFTNTYSQEQVEDLCTWKVVKCSSSDGALMLPGATFELKDAAGNKVADGISEQTSGKVTWTPVENADLTKLRGSYTLTETKAPNGYVLSEESWTLVFKENGELNLEESSKPDLTKNLAGITLEDKEYTILIKNDVLYTLPSTGGGGIKWYLVGGTMLMMAAALILYKNKRGEVLGS